MFAESEFKLNVKQPDGATLRDHLLTAYQASGNMHQMLVDAPELPELGAHVWDWFNELHSARGNTGFGPSPITFRDIADWASVTGRRIEPWEVQAIRLMDAAWMATEAEKHND